MKTLSNKTYDRLKAALTILFPATAAFYATVATLLEWSYALEVSGVLAALATYLGVLLNLASQKFWAEAEMASYEDLE